MNSDCVKERILGMKVLYFTATGNSLAVAKRIGGELISIPRAMHDGALSFADDAVGLVFPVYACSIPPLVGEFLGKAEIRAGYLFAVGTYGMTKGAAMREAAAVAMRRGLSFDYVNGVLMLDNCIPLFDMEAQMRGLPKKHVDDQIESIVRDVGERRRFLQKPSLFDYAATAALSLAWKAVKVLRPEALFRVDDGCTGCGTCARVCPTGSVSVGDRVEFRRGCCFCQACVHACPEHAIHIFMERGSGRWRNPAVSLREIMESNDVT